MEGRGSYPRVPAPGGYPRRGTFKFDLLLADSRGGEGRRHGGRDEHRAMFSHLPTMFNFRLNRQRPRLQLRDLHLPTAVGLAALDSLTFLT